MTAAGRSFYHDVSLRGPVPDRLLVRPREPQGADPALVERLVHIAERRPEAFFSRESPSFAYAQSFAWLPCLTHAGEGRAVAETLFLAWLRDFGRYAPQSWSPPLAARRTEHLLRGAGLLLDGRDAPFREQVFGTLIRQTRHLARRVRRAGSERQRLTVLAGLALGGLCLPHAADQERASRDPLSSALHAFSSGDIPLSLRDPAKALRLGISLQLLTDGYAERRLTPPAGLAEARSLMRLLLGGLSLPDGGMAVPPGRQEGDRQALSALSPVLRAESDALVARLGVHVLRGGETSLHADAGSKGADATAAAFCLADGQDRIVTAAGLPSDGLRATDPWAERWATALDQPAAAATLDAKGLGPATVTVEGDEEGTLAVLTRRGGGHSHTRRLFLSADGRRLIGEDRAAPPPSVFRFPLHPSVETRGLADGRATLVLPSGKTWRFEAGDATVDIEEGVYAAGGRTGKCRQIVLSTPREGVRWALRKL